MINIAGENIDNDFYFQELIEKTFDIDKDVLLLYNRLVKPFSDNLIRNPEPIVEYLIFDGKSLKVAETDSFILQTADCKKAHLVNPVKVYFYLSENLQSLYGVNKLTKEKLIRIVINSNKLIKVYKNQKLLKSLFSLPTVTNTIAHELSHWVRDTNSNFYLTKLHNLSTAEALYLNKESVDVTHFEIDALIHAIKNIKRVLNHIDWDSITLIELFSLYDALRKIVHYLVTKHKPEVYLLWQKHLLKRLEREGLLGKSISSGSNMEQLKKKLKSYL